MPMRYDFHDYRGEGDYRQQFVTKLLQTNTGQCHSLPLLYKILAEEMGVKAYLAFAPNHSYIRHQDEQGRWYNLELTNGRYVTSHALMRFGYVKTAALKNRVYLDTLSRKQTIGACLVDLVLEYDAKFGAFRREAFMHPCIDGVLQRQPNHVQAWIVKGSLIDAELYRAVRQSNYASAAQIPSHSPVAALRELQLQIYARIESLGFAQMPAAQYEAWRAGLGCEQSRRKSR
jgi:hypothetical protein